jgi:hypothetical protein
VRRRPHALGNLNGLRALIDRHFGNLGVHTVVQHSRMLLAGLVAGRGDLDGLRTLAEAGDGWAGRLLPDLLARQGPR